MKTCNICNQTFTSWDKRNLNTCKRCSYDKKNAKRRKTPHKRNGPYHFNEEMLDYTNLTATKAFWYGFFVARCSQSNKNGHHLNTISGFTERSYTEFCKDFDSDYRLFTKQTACVRITSKAIFGKLQNIIANYKQIITPQFEEYFVSGFLATKGGFRWTKSKSGGTQTVGFDLENMDNSIVSYVSAYLTKRQIQHTISKRERLGSIIHTLRVNSATNLITLYRLLNLKENYHLYSDNMNNFVNYCTIISTELQSRSILKGMIEHDRKLKLKQSHLASKYRLNIKAIKRFLQVKEDRLHTLLLDTSTILKSLGTLQLCPKCSVFVNPDEECIYCQNMHTLSTNKSYSVLQQDCGGQVRAGIVKYLAGKDTSGRSIQYYTDWTFPQLVRHLESQFEPWMNWNNWTVYSARKWDQDDATTWVWHLDHIVPQSDFKFRDKTDPEFRQCWALSNLRPYPGNLNVKDGATRLRHK